MPLISVIQECYDELEKIKKELIEQKKAKGQPTKTTFSEVVCMLIREHHEHTQNIPLIHKNGLAQNSSSENTSPTSYSAAGNKKIGLPEDGAISSSPPLPPLERELT